MMELTTGDTPKPARLAATVGQARRLFGADRDDADVFRAVSSEDTIRAAMKSLRSTDRLFNFVAGVNIVLLTSAGVVKVQESQASPGLAALVLGALFGFLPAMAIFGSGHRIPDLLRRPTLPAALMTEEMIEADQAQAEEAKRPEQVALVFLAVALVGSVLFATRHLINSMNELGINEPVDLVLVEVSQAVLIPACVEIFLGGLIVYKLVKNLHLDRLRAQAGLVRGPELEQQKAHQELGFELASSRQTFEKARIARDTQFEIEQRELLFEAALRESMAKAAEASRVKSAERHARNAIKVEDEKRAAALEIEQITARAEVDRAKAQAKLAKVITKAQLDAQLDAAHAQIDAGTYPAAPLPLDDLTAVGEIVNPDPDQAGGSVSAPKAVTGPGPDATSVMYEAVNGHGVGVNGGMR